MKKMIVAALAVAVTGAAFAQQGMKPEDAIKYRQAGYAFMGWNMGKIKANLEGTFNKDDVVKAANAIQGIANSGMKALYPSGSDKGTGFHETKVKPEFFSEEQKVGKIAGEFNTAANELAKVAATGDAAAVKAAFGKLGGTCKDCHDSYRNK